MQTDWDWIQVLDRIWRGWGSMGRSYDLDARAQWLLAEDVQAELDCLDGLLGVDGGRGGDDDGLQVVLGEFDAEHLIVAFVGADLFEVAVCPGELLLVGRRGCDQVRSGGEVVEVQRVSGAHAAEAGDGDVELG